MNDLFFLKTCALLHDIGKPLCWADKRPWSEHIYYTERILRESLGLNFAVSAMHHHTGVNYPAEYHPKTDLEEAIALADNISSGADRPEEVERATPGAIKLAHVLSKNRAKNLDVAWLKELSEQVQDGLKQFASVFASDPKKGYFMIFDYLEKSNLKMVPADTREPVNDVSLWDHLKLTAAFASCIWIDCEGKIKTRNPEKYEFALISGDANRIKDYIGTSSRLPDLVSRSEKVRKATKKLLKL